MTHLPRQQNENKTKDKKEGQTNKKLYLKSVTDLLLIFFSEINTLHIMIQHSILLLKKLFLD